MKQNCCSFKNTGGSERKRIARNLLYVYTVLVLLFVFFCCRHSTPGPVNSPTKNITPVSKKLFLWQIRHSGKESYILGSLHFMKKEYFPLHETIEHAFSLASKLVVETYMSSADRVAITMKRGVFPADVPDSLKNHITDSTYQAVKKKLTTFGADIRLFEKFKPWYLAQTISFLDMMKNGYHPNYAIDKYFLDKAEEGKKEICGLERLEEQLDFYDSFPPQVNEAFLLSGLKTDSSNDDDGMSEILTAWFNGDADSMEQLVKNAVHKSPHLELLYEELIYKRNIHMADRIASLLNQSSDCYFIVIGASHLVGKRGVLHRLTDNGFSIKQMSGQ